jgi:hypothetical protein
MSAFSDSEVVAQSGESEFTLKRQSHKKVCEFITLNGLN